MYSFNQKQTEDKTAYIQANHMIFQATGLERGNVLVCYFKLHVLGRAFNLPTAARVRRSLPLPLHSSLKTSSSKKLLSCWPIQKSTFCSSIMLPKLIPGLLSFALHPTCYFFWEISRYSPGNKPVLFRNSSAKRLEVE